jgi:hypothetical protein
VQLGHGLFAPRMPLVQLLDPLPGLAIRTPPDELIAAGWG